MDTLLTRTYPHTNTDIYTSLKIKLEEGKKVQGWKEAPRMQWSPPPCSPGQALMQNSVAAGVMQSCNQPPKPPRHCTHPTPPIPLIHRLTSPNRPPLPVTKITIFKIHSRAFAYTHCADWNLKGEMQNAVCGWSAIMQQAGFTNTTPSSPLLSLGPPDANVHSGAQNNQKQRLLDHLLYTEKH